MYAVTPAYSRVSNNDATRSQRGHGLAPCTSTWPNSTERCLQATTSTAL